MVERKLHTRYNLPGKARSEGGAGLDGGGGACSPDIGSDRFRRAYHPCFYRHVQRERQASDDLLHCQSLFEHQTAYLLRLQVPTNRPTTMGLGIGKWLAAGH